VRYAIIGSLLTLLFAGHNASAGATTSLDVFTDAEKRIIREYCRSHESAAALCGGKTEAQAGHGKKKRKSLPPGIAKNLQRGKPLPPGIAKQVLPEDLEDRLPRRNGYERLIVDGRVILIDVATRIIRDVLEDVLLPD
jgi:hypothetical protein